MKTLKNLIKRVMGVLLIPLLVIGGLPLGINNVYAAEGDEVPPTIVPDDAPAHGKKLVDNGDGTYTLSLSVTGKASSSTTQEVTKSNVILLIDTSGSMNNPASGYNGTRLEAEKNALTKTDGIIDKLLANNTEEITDIIELYGINFGTGGTKAWDWSTNGTTIKNAINNLSTNSGTNWEEALRLAKEAADAKHTAEPDDNTYVIILTDGQPTTHYDDYSVNTNYTEEWGYAKDDARAIVTAGYTFYGVYTFGPTNVGANTTCNTQNTGGSICLKSLVNYAYTGTGNANSALSSDYAQYFYDATDTQALISALEAIVNEISSSVGYTNIAITDGLTDLTSSIKVDGKISNLTYTRSGGSYGDGTVWTNAPAATTTNGTIKWDLGKNVLEDGVTYTVSFVVWPSQESYDLVADLNNGKRTYSSLSDSQKASIINTDGVYTLKTNTDYPTLTYSTVTTTTSNEGTTVVTSEPTTFSIANPDPVGLKNEKLTLEKKWEDSLDPSQRKEVEEVVLDLYKDGSKYEEGIHLNQGNNWKLPNHISIAPGVMISSDSSNYELLKGGHTEYSFDGKTYIILETGHDYYFAEDDINSHFELTNYIYHPMLVDNEMKNVFFVHDGSDNIIAIKEFKRMDSVSATNTLKGGINIQKKVEDKNGNEIDTNDSFEVTVHLVDAEGNPYAYDYRIYYGEKNPEYESHKVLNEDGSVKYSRTDHIYGTGDIKDVTLYIGDTIRIVNVDSGVKYYVEETEKAGYATNPTITYKEAYGTDSSVDSTETTDGYYVVSGNTASSATVINKFLDERTTIDFKKNWYDADGNVLSGKTLPGSITIDLLKKDKDGKLVSAGVDSKIITADTNWRGSFTDLPKYDNGEEIVYSVKESAIEGATYDDQKEAFFEYDSEENNGKHAVVGRWTVETLDDIIVKNTWKPATERVSGKTSFNIVKIDKTTKKVLPGATFELKLKDGTTFTATTDDEGKAIFENLNAGEYTLKETDAPNGYKKVLTEPNINITSIKQLNSVNLDSLENLYEYVFSFSTAQVNGYKFDTKTRTFTVENEAIPYDDINVSKVWDDDDDRDGLRNNYKNYYVAVKNNSGKFVAYKKLALVNQDYVFEHLPTKTVEGDDITYEVVEASTCSGSDSSIKCTEFKGDKNYAVTIKNGTITNFHEPALYDETGELIVQKIWDGEGNELARPNTITIELYANGVLLGEPVTISAANEWKHTFKNLYKNESGEPIVYSVQESKLGETAFGESESTIIVYNNDNAVVGSWTKSVDNDKHEVTNTWKEAKDQIVYEGEKEFTIKKVDDSLKPLSGVVFAVEGHSDKTTNEDGEITITVPITKTEKEESFEYKISEKKTKEGYDLVGGSATITISCTSKLSSTDTISDIPVNTYTKTCNYNKTSDSDKFKWDGKELTLMVINNRSMAESLTIEKTVKGLSPEVLTDLEFMIEGPEDFGEDGKMTLVVKDDCTISGEVITCKVNGKVPTGKYKVTENNADVEHFELSFSGDNGKEKNVAKNEDVKFKITNKYEVEKISYYVDKIWEDAHNKDGKRPEKLMVNLLANGEIIKTVDMTMSDAYIIGEEDEGDYVTGDIWGIIWEGLPYADENAEQIVYTAEEVLESDDYEQMWVGGDEYATTFVNYHEPEEDPCANGGCGGTDTTPIETPETGRLVKNEKSGAVDSAWLNNMICGGVALLVGALIIVFTGKHQKA